MEIMVVKPKLPVRGKNHVNNFYTFLGVQHLVAREKD
jgi:hypothetical protein